MQIILLFYLILDTILKAFQMVGFILIPTIIIIIILFNKKKKLYKSETEKIKKIDYTIICLIMMIVICVFTVRSWGAEFYKLIINNSMTNQSNKLEEQLEKKYGKNFTYVSNNGVMIDENERDAAFSPTNNMYYTEYIFKDDDEVIALVKYKKDYQSDYYESKRNKYEIEKEVTEFLKTVGLNNNFYFHVESPYELITNTSLDAQAKNYNIEDKCDGKRFELLLTEKSDKSSNLTVSALKKICRGKAYSVNEYILTKEEYDKAINFYEDIKKKPEVEDNGYYLFDSKNILESRFEYIK